MTVGSPSEYAPRAILACYERLTELRPRGGFHLGGIIGDSAHTYGYHRARAVLPSDDYSVTLKRDRTGPEWACSALDITPEDPSHLLHLTRRAARAVASKDPRFVPFVREVAGTVNGTTVWAWDLARGQATQFDPSHLFHMHLSFYRDNNSHPRAYLGVAEVLAGKDES